MGLEKLGEYLDNKKSSYEEMYNTLNDSQKNQISTNFLIYGYSINESDIFFAKNV